ncbi:MAG: L-histidine N(alpha)-methyltransferase [Actinomycetota bacterium]|nr:L-histidine N(alpha)-methyltransferase [Actinomycetota bacterium]
MPDPGARGAPVKKGDLAAALRADVAAGLTSSPKELPSKWFYDEEGSALFDTITRLEEYYPTRRERAILTARAREVAELTGAEVLIELGSGTSEKTRLLLDALRAAGTLRCFVPFDVDAATLDATAGAIAADYPGVEVHPVVGDFEADMGLLPVGGRRLVAFLGSTIGNLTPSVRAGFLGGIGAALQPGDAFLLGVDLVKDTARLEAAYDDAAGVTAAFNRNLLRRINRELDADFAPERFDHVARFDADAEWIEMLLRSRIDQVVTVGALNLSVVFTAGEEMRTEISAKFRPEGVEAELTAAGLTPLRFWTDPAGDFGLSLAVAK